MKQYAVVKFNSAARYAKDVFSSYDLKECERWAAKASLLYKGYSHLSFVIYDKDQLAMCQHLEDNGMGTLYTLLANENQINCSKYLNKRKELTC